jgi:phospholipid/cholesterol/gamma-HCH transport system substrate-binding protein
MKGYSEARLIRLGAITMVVMALLLVATFNLSKFPGFGGTIYTAEFADASGIHRGNMVQVAGMRVGRVEKVSLEGDKVIVEFEVDNGVEFGEESRASVEVLNLLG